ncbi:hypothetical protein C7E25_22025, partial [Stenotrophomonas maltophilia]
CSSCCAIRYRCSCSPPPASSRRSCRPAWCSCPMQELAAGQQQLVRVMRPDRTPPPAQQHYRLIVDEVPDLATRAEGMQFVLRYSIPVFVQPAAGKLAPQLQARLVQLPD